jgi:tetratricopeptide (TPR) repeat protein
MSVWLTSNSFWGVFWIDVGSESTAKNDFLTVAKALGSPTENVDEARQALANSKKRWLLVLDNADDVYFDYKRYIPSGVQGAIIMTSRNPECSRYGIVAAEKLEGLDPEHSAQLLLKAARVPEEVWQSCETQAQAHDIVKLLWSHTLALIQAGAYVAEGFCQLAEYPKKYQQHHERLLKHHPEQEQSRYRDVFATFEASADALKCSGRQDGRDALDLLAVLCMLHSGVFPLGVLKNAWLGTRGVLVHVPAETDGTEDTYKMDQFSRWHVTQLPKFVDMAADEWDDYRLKNASKRLVSLSLVTRHALGDGGGDGGLSMHPLAHAWAKDRLETEQQQQAWIMVGCVLTLSRRQTELWHKCERELRLHLLAYLSPNVQTMLSSGPQKAVLAILLECGWALNTMREDARLEKLLNDICEMLNITPSGPLKEHLPIWDLVARTSLDRGYPEQAMELSEKIGKIRGAILEKTDPDLLGSQHNTAVTYRENGRIKDALDIFERIFEIAEHKLGKTDERRLTLQHQLGITCHCDGQTSRAVALLLDVVNIKEAGMEKTHPSRLSSEYALAIAYRADGQIPKAVALLEQVVKIEQTQLEKDNPSLLQSQHALAGAYWDNGQKEKALALLNRVVEIERTITA